MSSLISIAAQVDRLVVEVVVEGMKSAGTRQCGLERMGFLRSRSSVGGRNTTSPRTQGHRNPHSLLLIWSEWDTLWNTDSHARISMNRVEFPPCRPRATVGQRIGVPSMRQAGDQRGQFADEKGQCKRIRNILKEDLEAPELPTCMSSRFINFFDLLTPVDTHRISLNTHTYTPCPVSAVDCLERNLQKHAFFGSLVRAFEDFQQNIT